ncbi:MAG: hypothetical protein LBN27_05970 [Prevotellaceae bacterium]|nr:hypothetical protein [Prevotellaceae bacterium]
MKENTIKQEKTPEEKKSEGKKSAVGCLVIIAIIALIVWALYPNKEERTNREVYRVSMEQVSKYLKSPKTAEFSNGTLRKTGENQYQVRGSVDSQNGFGAMVRSEYIINLHLEGDTWIFDYLDINGQMIY